MELSIGQIEIMVGLSFPMWSLLHIEWGIRLTLGPRSYKARLMEISPTAQGMEKIPVSLSLGGSLFWRIALHSSLRKTMPFS